MTTLRHETHYGDRVVRCFAQRHATIDAMFRAAAARAPERDALVLGDERMPYRALDATVEAIAGNLTARGLRAVLKITSAGLQLRGAAPVSFDVAAHSGYMWRALTFRRRRSD